MATYVDCTVTLDHVEPAIWRRFLLMADATVEDLHLAIQAACGWENYHLYDFTTRDGKRFGIPDPFGPEVQDAAGARLKVLVGREKATLTYRYDFGDGWEHTIHLLFVDAPGAFHRRLLDGARAFPPEDCGGYGGYAECVEVVQGRVVDPERREWIGNWDPERFDQQAVARHFDAGERPDPYRPRRFERLPTSVRDLDGADVDRYFTAERLGELSDAARDCVALARLRAFSQWVGEGRKLTATGNLTLAHGAELVELLGTDDVINPRIGDRVFKTTSTAELPGLHGTFQLARQAGFVKIRKGTVSATRRGDRLGKNHLADWNEAFRALQELGILRQWYAGNRYFDPYWADLLDETLPEMLGFISGFITPCPLALLEESAWRMVQASFVFEDAERTTVDTERTFVENDVYRMCEELQEFGVVELPGRDSADRGIDAGSHRTTGTVTLTALGQGVVAAIR